MLRLYEEDSNETFSLVANEDHSQLRIATAEEATDDNIPKVTAKLRGAELIGNSTNQLLLSVSPSAPPPNWPAVRQVTISNTAAVPDTRTAHEEIDVITKPKARKTRRLKRNRAHPINSSASEPSKNITKVMDRFMDSLEDESIGRIVDLLPTSHEDHNAIIKAHAIEAGRSNCDRDHLTNTSAPDPVNNIVKIMDRFMDSLEDESVRRIVDLQPDLHEEQEGTKETAKEEAILITQGEKLKSSYGKTLETEPSANNVLMASIPINQRNHCLLYTSDAADE